MGSFSQGHALVVGVADYADAPRLPTAVLHDAADVAAVLRDFGRCGYPSNQVRHLSDSQATAEAIRQGLDWLARTTSEESTVLFFFSGHGWREEAGGRVTNYLLGHDAWVSDAERRGLIDGPTLTAHLRAIRAERLVVIFDCCHAAGAELKSGTLGHRDVQPGLDDNCYERLRQGKGRALLASSRTDEFSLVLSDMRNSLFTHYLLCALSGEAARDNGEIGVLDVFGFLSERVPHHGGGQPQHPVFKGEIENNLTLALGLRPRQEENVNPYPAQSSPAVIQQKVTRSIAINAAGPVSLSGVSFNGGGE